MKQRPFRLPDLYDQRRAAHSAQPSIQDIPSAYRLFFEQSMQAWGPTASLFPSSRYLANALIRPIDFRRARTVVELGPGTGAVTNEILKRLRPDGKLIAVDINQTFIHHLRNTCHDPRLVPLCGSAADLRSLLAVHDVGPHNVAPVGAVGSSFGLTAMDNQTRPSILRHVGACLLSTRTLTHSQPLVP